jgi:hypothetical protein
MYGEQHRELLEYRVLKVETRHIKTSPTVSWFILYTIKSVKISRSFLDGGQVVILHTPTRRVKTSLATACRGMGKL